MATKVWRQTSPEVRGFFLFNPAEALIALAKRAFLLCPFAPAGGQGEGGREQTFEALAKLAVDHSCHSERSEESRVFS
jgi:hypothetical protein